MTIQAKQHIGMRGFFTLQAHQEDDDGRTIPGSVRELGAFENLILDNGLELMKGSGGWLGTIAVGSGSTAPAVSDTQLGALVASIGATPAQGASNLSATPPYVSATLSVQFAKGAAAGNLSEIGAGASATSLFSRSLIKDANGNPTTITVLAIEYLTVSYELRMYFDTAAAPVTGSVTIDAVDYATSTILGDIKANMLVGWAKRAEVGAYRHVYYAFGTGALGAAGVAVPGASTMQSGSSWTAGPAGSFYIDGSIHLGVNDQNKNITAIGMHIGYFNTYPAVKTGFSPPIPKDNTKEMDITMRLEYGRYQAP